MKEIENKNDLYGIGIETLYKLLTLRFRFNTANT